MSIQNSVVAPPQRALAPDVARGLMLLLIAISNVSAYLYAQPMGMAGLPVMDSPVDQVATMLQSELFVHRTWPLFALLYGYGMVQLWNSRYAADTEPARIRRLLRRRGWVLLLLGFGHAAALWAGDILGAYGIIAIVFSALLLRAKDRVLLGIAMFSILVVGTGGAASAVPLPEGQHSPLPSTGRTDVFLAVGERLIDWLPTLALQPFGMVGAVALGVWAARRGLLEEPGSHSRLLARVAVVGLGLAVAGGLPFALILSGLWSPDLPVAMFSGALHSMTGYGGVGYAALAGLAVAAVRRPGAISQALAATGQRSLTCYLTQSVLFVALLASYGGGLGAGMGIATATVIAIAVWTVTVVIADLLRRNGYRGPAEVLLRRFSRVT